MGKGKRLEELILNSRYKNINQFSKASKVPYTTIKSFIERDLEKASIDSVVKMAKVLNVPVEYLVDEGIEIKELPSSNYDYFPTAISAGLPIEVDGVTETKQINLPDSIMGKWSGHKDIFISKINGESMNKLIPDNSLIAVKSITLHSLKNGDIVVYSDNHEYSVKQYYKQDDEILFRPNSTDYSFRDDIYKLDNVDDLLIHGKVVLYTVELD